MVALSDRWSGSVVDRMIQLTAAEATRLFLRTHFDQSESEVAALQHSNDSSVTCVPVRIAKHTNWNLCWFSTRMFSFQPHCH